MITVNGRPMKEFIDLIVSTEVRAAMTDFHAIYHSPVKSKGWTPRYGRSSRVRKVDPSNLTKGEKA